MSQVTRVIRINTANTANRIALDSAATTWGELQKEMLAHPIAKLALDGNVKALVRETRVTLENDDAQLPPFDCQLIMTVKKSKGGALNDEYTPMDSKQLTAACKSKGIKVGSTNSNTRSKLRLFDKKNGTSSTSTKAEVVKKPRTAKKVSRKTVAPVQKAKGVCVDPEVKAKMEKKAKKAAKKAAKQAKKDAKVLGLADSIKGVINEDDSKSVCPAYDVDADLNAISKATTDIEVMDDNQQPSAVISALGRLSKTSETTSAVANLVAIAVEKVRTYEFAPESEVKSLRK